MKLFANSTMLGKSFFIQAAVIVALWALLFIYVYFDFEHRLDSKISIASFIGIPAAVIAVAQLLITAHVQRASYIKDYALRFRTDKEFSESFHYLVYLYGNKLYDVFMLDPKKRTKKQTALLNTAQKDVAKDLCFFDPTAAGGLAQERRLDNLLGFFDTLAYDYSRRLVAIKDIAGVFGFHLDHLIQRKVVDEYLRTVEKRWPQLESFHQRYRSPVPFDYLRKLIGAYIEYRKIENAKHSS
jgi:hypothetical protein